MTRKKSYQYIITKNKFQIFKYIEIGKNLNIASHLVNANICIR